LKDSCARSGDRALHVLHVVGLPRDARQDLVEEEDEALFSAFTQRLEQ